MKNIKNFLFLLLTVGLMLSSSTRTYSAYEGEKIDNVSAWSSGTSFVSVLTRSKGENMAQLAVKWMTGIGDVLLGLICPQCVITEPEISAADLPEGMKLGLVGITENQVVAMFENQPNIDVVAHLAEEWVPGYKDSQSVYASGYDDLNQAGIVALWTFTRNIAYLCFVIIMIVIGFMIMFRNKIGGQMLVTIGNTLPRIVVSLVLVTFSFALVGIILDISGIIMRVIGSGNFLDSNIQIHKIGELLWGVVSFVPAGSVATGGGFLVGTVLVITSFLGPVGPILILLALVVLGIVVFGAIKLWFALLKAYLSILLNVITGPLVIMSGALPGNDAAIINYFKSVFRNALVFPVAFAIVNLPYFLSEQANISLSFPDTIVGESGDIANIGKFILAIAQIMAIYVAAQTPKFMLAIIPSTASKSGADAAAAIKEGFSKVPMLGGLFK